MNQFDWRSTIKINIFALRLIGLWPKGDGTYKKDIYTFYSASFLLSVLWGHVLLQTINLFLILDDLEALSETLCVTLSCIIGVLKTYLFFQNMDTLKKLMMTLREEMFLPKNPKQKNLIQTGIKTWKWIYAVFALTCGSCAFFWSTYPIFDNTSYRLPLMAKFPFETTTSPNYEIAYVYQVVFIWLILSVNLNTDILISALNMIIGAQCDLLCDNLREMNKEEFEKVFKNCIKHHKAILQFAEKCNTFYSWILLFQFFTSAVSIGFSMFRLTQVALLSSEFYSLIIYENAVLVEIFLYCWFGNEVEIKSSRIPYSVFESDWMDAPEIYRYSIIFTIRTQRNIKPSALNLFYLSLNTFKAILRTAWSYFAVLSQVNSQ